MKKFLIQYLQLNKAELNGMLALTGLIVVIGTVPWIYGLVYPTDNILTPEARQAIQVLTKQIKEKQFRERSGRSHTPEQLNLASFDPNKLGIDGWRAFGLSEKQAASIVNYVRKGGRFRKPEDLQKMYTIRPDLYRQLRPYVVIAPNENTNFSDTKYPSSTYKKTIVPLLDVNMADSAALDALKGIGPAFAKRIIGYRKRLGGFVHIEQLREVYGIDSARFEQLKEQVKIGPELHRININSATFDELKSHPYLKFKQLNALIQYRKQHGRFSGPEDLKKVIALNEETIQKLLPYLDFQ